MNAATKFLNESTTDQRNYISSLLRRAELATDRFTYQHRAPFKAARLPEPIYGHDIDAHLRALTKTQASALIDALKAQIGADEDDGDDD